MIPPAQMLSQIHEICGWNLQITERLSWTKFARRLSIRLLTFHLVKHTALITPTRSRVWYTVAGNKLFLPGIRWCNSSGRWESCSTVLALPVANFLRVSPHQLLIRSTEYAFPAILHAFTKAFCWTPLESFHKCARSPWKKHTCWPPYGTLKQAHKGGN